MIRPSRKKAFVKRGAFTLIELLVVIAIIAVLASMGFSFAKSSIQKSQAGKCAGNLKQLAAIVLAYATDYGHYPPIIDQDGSCPPEMSVNFPVFYYHASPNACATCPSAKHTGKNTDNPPTQLIHQNAYAANPKIMIGSATYKKVTPLMINRPSEVVLLADGAQFKNSKWWAAWPYMVGPGGVASWQVPANSNGAETPLKYGTTPIDVDPNANSSGETSINFRHNGRANIVFCDGHVQSITNISQLKQKNIYWSY